MQTRMRSGWFGWLPRVDRRSVAASTRVARVGGAVRFPTYAAVTLPDGQLMHVRNASLAAAKDLLAAQRAIERRLRMERQRGA